MKYLIIAIFFLTACRNGPFWTANKNFDRSKAKYDYYKEKAESEGRYFHKDDSCTRYLDSTNYYLMVMKIHVND